jgi:hypothetical protein
MSNCTPGPWKALVSHELVDVVAADGWPVLVGATIPENSHPEQTVEVALANATLMAAAPEMLAACEAALVEIEATTFSSHAYSYERERVQPIVAELRNAIAKAKAGAN